MGALENAWVYAYGRVGWAALLLVWLGLAVGGGADVRRWLGPSIAAAVGVLVVAEAATFITKYAEGSVPGNSKEIGFIKIHLAAAILHVASANGIGWATAGYDDGWLARIIRTRSTWEPQAYNKTSSEWVSAIDYYKINNSVLEPKCANYPCIIKTETVVVTDKWPLVSPILWILLQYKI